MADEKKKQPLNARQVRALLDDKTRIILRDNGLSNITKLLESLIDEVHGEKPADEE